MTSCEYVQNPDILSKDRVLKQVVGTCKCGKDLKDKRSICCSDCLRMEQWNKLTVRETMEVLEFNERWERVHGIKNCADCQRSYNVDNITKCTIFPLMENNVGCKEFTER